MSIHKEAATKKPATACPSTFKTFSLAVQALVALERHSGKCSSGDIASYLHLESTLIRRILKTLAHADMIESREGRDGGYRLKKNASDITLAEVYSILQVHNSISDGMLDATTGHCFAAEIRESFAGILSEIEESTLKILESRTIADMVEQTI
ncbi:transcriptional regulator, BadM/Rrf2 family protein [Paenibacillus vortex V453]|uniref:Transcriptional regulator, BadM/Rrf2 family protein n=1 Tax=Paenibacillus vortex V453 TaxID=715225 RepID=A0A2R9SSQ3_9BACL|nr:Rrf2 family transcriptional regulator [Paenibacillus vortex]EFU40410.1 transcriptional regulator, BadM/Rrf2 family protein [Paenibacillus vortex V453]